MTLDTTRLDGEQRFPHGLGSEWKPWEAFSSSSCLARVALWVCRVERSSGHGRAGSNHREQVCLVAAEWDLDRI